MSAESASARRDIETLFVKINAAIGDKDRRALEALYDADFLFVHGLGFVDTRTDLIDDFLDSDLGPNPLPEPDFDEILDHGSVIVGRSITINPVAGNRLVSTSLFRRGDGGVTMLQVQSTQMQFDHLEVEISPAEAAAFAGTYRSADGPGLRVFVDDARLFAKVGGLPRRRLAVREPGELYDKQGMSYRRSADGHLVTTARNGVVTTWERVADEDAGTRDVVDD